MNLRLIATASILIAVGCSVPPDQASPQPPTVTAESSAVESTAASAPGAETAMSDLTAMSDFVSLGSLLSAGDPAVVERLHLFDTDPQEFAVRYADDLANRGLELEDLTELNERYAVVLNDALLQAGLVVYEDHRGDTGQTLAALDRMANGQLAQNAEFVALQSRFPADTWYGLGELIDGPAEDRQALRSAIRSAGFELEGIDENSDSYALVLIPLDKSDEARRLGDSAGVGFYFNRLYPDS